VVGIVHVLAYASHRGREPRGMLPECVRSTNWKRNYLKLLSPTLEVRGSGHLPSLLPARHSVCTSKDWRQQHVEHICTISLNLSTCLHRETQSGEVKLAWFILEEN